MVIIDTIEHAAVYDPRALLFGLVVVATALAGYQVAIEVTRLVVRLTRLIMAGRH